MTATRARARTVAAGATGAGSPRSPRSPRPPGRAPCAAAWRPGPAARSRRSAATKAARSRLGTSRDRIILQLPRLHLSESAKQEETNVHVTHTGLGHVPSTENIFSTACCYSGLSMRPVDNSSPKRQRQPADTMLNLFCCYFIHAAIQCESASMQKRRPAVFDRRGDPRRRRVVPAAQPAARAAEQLRRVESPRVLQKLVECSRCTGIFCIMSHSSNILMPRSPHSPKF